MAIGEMLNLLFENLKLNEEVKNGYSSQNYYISMFVCVNIRLLNFCHRPEFSILGDTRLMPCQYICTFFFKMKINNYLSVKLNIVSLGKFNED